MATHSYESAPVARCIEHEHVQANYPCTWLRISDVNDATPINLHGPAIREIALALAEHASKLERDARVGTWDDPAGTQAYRSLEITRDVARWLSMADFGGIMGNRASVLTDHELDKE